MQMLLKVKSKIQDEQVIQIADVYRQQLINEVQELIEPIAKQFAMYLFSSVPVLVEAFNQSDSKEGIILDVMNFYDGKLGDFYFTSILIVKDNKKRFLLSTSYLVSKWAFAFYHIDNKDVNHLMWCRYCENLEDLVLDFATQIRSILPDILEKIRKK